MQRDRQRLLDILDSARLALTYVAGKTLEEFLADTQCQDAVARRLAIIGEAAGRLSEATRNQFPDLAWSSMVGMRNFLIHEYGDIDLTIVWDTVQTSLPPVVGTLEKIV